MADWNPSAYARFRGLRLRPALDLLAQVPDLPEGPVVDLGCGDGAVGPALRDRFPGRRITGLDSSPAMLEQARGTGDYDEVMLGDASHWAPEAPPALIFSNATLHWLADHPGLFRHLSALLAAGGVLAVQMPRQFNAPSHRFLRDFAADMFPDRFDFTSGEAPVLTPVEYYRLMAGAGQVQVWETDYVQRLVGGEPGHPVRRFTEATAMRPFLDRLSPEEAAAFIDRYEDALDSAYPAEADGSVLFPFRRLFLVLCR